MGAIYAIWKHPRKGPITRRELHILLIAALLLPVTAWSRDDLGNQHQAMDATATDTATGPINATGIIRDLDLAARYHHRRP